ncbi:hypothetical protein BBK82_36060 [Lentzea guizhouensis]|uniref:Pentapeptide repeat-containing protein n=1 Tax=Lentzea guizhouensis TaxID=1586287 RepID=A0A1B2HSB4_9PSEU|nr:hypothetical protein BBK82_36060 [Lentzea guizhouensis]
MRTDTHADGPELCFAHATVHQRSEALRDMHAQSHVDVRGTTLTADHVRDILDTVHAARFDFGGCTFAGDAPFPGTRLKFRTASHNFAARGGGVSDFSDATFECGADFTKVEFPGPVFFASTTFADTVSFDRAHFLGDAWFLQTIMGLGVFTDATFADLAGFHAVCAEQLIFSGTTFSGRAYLDPVEASRVDLSDCVFSHRAVMVLNAHCRLDDARFEAGMELRMRAHRTAVSMRRTHLEAASIVSGSDTIDSRVRSHGHSFPLAPALLSLQGTDVDELTIANIDLTPCLFAGAYNLDKLRIEGRSRFLDFVVPSRPGVRAYYVNARGREIIMDEKLLHVIARKQRGVNVEAWLEKFARDRSVVAGQPDTGRDYDAITYERLAVIYRALRKGLEDAKDEPGAGDFYYGEMQARRHARSTRRVERFLLTVYWLISGYGQRASRALAALVLLLTMLTALLTGLGLPAAAPLQQFTGSVQPAPAPGGSQQVVLDARTPPATLPPFGDRWTAARLERAARLATGSIVFRDTDQQLTIAGRWTVNAGRGLGPLLLALAALAIRARVKR